MFLIFKNIKYIIGLRFAIIIMSIASSISAKFSPPCGTLRLSDIDALASIIASRRLVCLTGAGISTESGIPDYRSKKGSYSVGHKPMLHAEFVGSASNRKRYWLRSLFGFGAFQATKPN